jgi:hypothetical protein
VLVAGNIVSRNTISGANLYAARSVTGAYIHAGLTFAGAGLSDCDDATNSKLLWDATTKRFSCGTDQSGAGGLTLTSGDARYVNQSGDTMTGALRITKQGGYYTGNLLTVLGGISGRVLHAAAELQSSGTLVVTKGSTFNGTAVFGDSYADTITLNGRVLGSGGVVRMRATLSGTALTIDQGISASGALMIYGSTTLGDHLNDSIQINGRIVGTGGSVRFRTTISGTALNIDQNATISGSLVVDGAATFNGTTVFGDNYNDTITLAGRVLGSGGVVRMRATLSGYALALDQGATISGALVVDGASTFNGTTTFGDNYNDTITLNGRVIGSGGVVRVRSMLSGTSLRVDQGATISGSLVTSGDVTFNGTTLTFGDHLSDTINVGARIVASGGILRVRSVISGSSLKVDQDISASGSVFIRRHLSGATIAGFGLTSCSQNAQKLLWNNSTNKFVCGTDNGTLGTSQFSGAVLALTDPKYVKKAGDTMTGVLILTYQNTYTGGVLLNARGTISGKVLHASSELRSSGSLVVEGTSTFNGLTILGDSYSDSITLNGRVLGSGGVVRMRATLSGTSLHIDNGSTLSGGLTVDGVTLLNGNITLGGNRSDIITVQGIFTSGGSIRFRSLISGTTLHVDAGTTLSGGLVVDGITLLNGNITLGGNRSDIITVQGIFTSGGSIRFRSLISGTTLHVDAGTTLSGGLVVDGITLLNGNITLGGNRSDIITVQGIFTSGGSIRFRSTISGTSLHIDQDSSLSGALIVEGESTFNGAMNLGDRGSDLLTVYGTFTSGGYIRFRSVISGTSLKVDQNIAASGSLTVRRTISGALLWINRVTSDLIPNTTNTYSLGSTTNRWKDLYLSGGSLHIGAVQQEGTIGYNGSGTEAFTFNSDGYGPAEMVLSSGGKLGLGVGRPTQAVHIKTASGSAAQVFQTSGTAAGPRNGSAFADDIGQGSDPWTNHSNAATSNNSFATNALGMSATSYYLRATDFSFNIPSNATIKGIVAEVERKASGNTITDNAVRLMKADIVGSTDRRTTAPWPSRDTYAYYGNPTDLWGDTWTPDDINASGFGFAISVTNSDTNAVTTTASIDHIRITVYYTTPTAVAQAWSIGTSIADGSFKIMSGSALGTGNEALSISTANLVRIGAGTPTAKLDVVGTISGSRLSISNNANISGALLAIGNITTRGTLSGSRLVVSGHANISGSLITVGNITGYGNITSRGTISGSRLIVSGHTNISGALLTIGNITTRGTLSGYNLTVSRSASISGALLVKGNIATKGTLSGAALNVMNGGTSYVLGSFGVGTASPKAKFDVAGTISGARLVVSGNANISGSLIVDGDIVPGITNTYNLGSDALRWKDLFLSGATIHMGASGDEGTFGYDGVNNRFVMDVGGDGSKDFRFSAAGSMDFAEVSSDAPTAAGYARLFARPVVAGGNDAYTTYLVTAESANGTAQNTAIGKTNNSAHAGSCTSQSSDQAKFGTRSIKFNCSGYQYYKSISNDERYPSANFTVDMWVYEGANTSTLRRLIAATNSSNLAQWGLELNASNKLQARLRTSTGMTITFADTTDFAVNEWVHVALERNADTFRLYVNGSVVATRTYGGNLYNSLAYLMLGNPYPYNTSGYQNFTGYMDEIRISKIARYSGAFTPETAEYQLDSGGLFIRLGNGSVVKLSGTGGSVESSGGTDGAWTINDDNTIYYAINNVGVGTTTPGAALHVVQEIASGSGALRVVQSAYNSTGALIASTATGAPLLVLDASEANSRSAAIVFGSRDTFDVSLWRSAAGTLKTDGSLHIVGTISGTHLAVSRSATISGALLVKDSITSKGSVSGSTIAGFNLGSCNSASQKLLYNYSTQKFECGSDQTGGGSSSFSTGNVLTIGDARYVNQSGDTMTGALTINVTGGNFNTVGLKIINTLSGASIHAERTLTTSGSLVFEGSASGASLYIATSINGAGLTDCDASSQKLAWDATTGRFSCAADQTGAAGSTFTCPSGFTEVTAQGRTLGCIQSEEADYDGDTVVNEAGDATTFDNAREYCFDTYGARLPTTIEWQVGASNYTLSNETDDWEWTSDLTNTAQHSVVGSAAITADSGANDTDSYVLRCWVPVDGGGVGTGVLVNVGDSRWVNTGGDTMTGALTINITNGNLNTVGLKIINTLSGASIHAERALTTSGTLVFEGAASGASLYVASSIQGAGLSDCDAASSKLLWDATTGRFSCGSDQTGGGAGTFSTGNVLTIGDARYVDVSGDTMTGTLVIQSGNSAATTLTPLLNVRGTMSGRGINIAGTGSSTAPLIYTDISSGRVGIGTSTPSAVFEIRSDAGNASLRNVFSGTPATNGGGGSFQGLLLQTPTAAGQRLGDFSFGAYDSAGTVRLGAVVRAFAGEAWGALASRAAYLTFETTPLSSTTRSERLRVTTEGDIGIATTTPKARLDVVGTISGSRLSISRNANITGALIVVGNVTSTSTVSGSRLVVSGHANISGSLVVKNSISGANLFAIKSVTGSYLYAGLTFAGAGLTDCDTAATSKLLWDATTKRFSCGTDQTGGGTAAPEVGTLSFSGAVRRIGDDRYVNQSGDTMTGILKITKSGGYYTGALLNVLGTMSGRSLYVSGSGGSTAPLLFANSANGRVGIGTNNAKALLHVQGTISGSQLRIYNSTTSTGTYIAQRGNGTALDIISNATTMDIINVDARGLTTGYGLDIFNANALTTGQLARFHSNSSNTSVRSLVTIVNDHASASRTTVLRLQQDASATGAFIDMNGNGVAFEIDSEATSQPGIRIDMPMQSASTYNPHILFGYNGTFDVNLYRSAPTELSISGALNIGPQSFSSVWYDTDNDPSTGLSDNVLEARTSSGTPVTVFAAENPSNDYFYVGLPTRFSKVTFNIARPGAGVSLQAQYYNSAGSWAELPLVDGTSGLTVDGSVTFNPLANWSLNSLNAELTSLYYIRFHTVDLNVTRSPTIYSVAPSGQSRFVVNSQQGDIRPLLYLNDQRNVVIGSSTAATGDAVLTVSGGTIIAPGVNAPRLDPRIALEVVGTMSGRNLIVTGTGGGPLFFTSVPAGSVGIGTGQNLSAKATIFTTDAFNKDALLIRSQETTATVNMLRIMTNFSTTNNTVFRVSASGAVYADGVYNSAGADYAEWFKTSTTLSPGEVVCIDVTKPNTVKRCDHDGDSNVMGIVSTHPAFVGNVITGADGIIPPGYALVGLIGQVPARVMVEGENGEIRPGDALTAASVPGYARKAKAGESTVGVALEGLESGEGVIRVLISRRNQSLTVETVEQKVLESIASMNIADEVQLLVQSASENLGLDLRVTDAITEQLAALDLTSQVNAIIDQRFASGAVLSGFSLDPITSALVSLTQTSSLLSQRVNTISGTLALLSARMDAMSSGQTLHTAAPAQSISSFTGALVLTGSGTKIGNISFSGSEVQIGTLVSTGALRVVGNITITGLTTLLGDVHVKGELVLSNRQAGFAVIPATGTSVTVRFVQQMTGTPIVQATPHGRVGSEWWIENATMMGFTIRTDETVEKDVRFAWTALSAEDPVTTTGTGSAAVNTPFPVNSLNQPISSDPVWNSCVKGQPIILESGEPVNCARYHVGYDWQHPDLGILFTYNPNNEPPILTVPEGYVVTVIPDASSSSSSVSSSESSSASSESSSDSSSSASSESSDSSYSASSESSESSSSSSSSVSSEASSSSSSEPALSSSSSVSSSESSSLASSESSSSSSEITESADPAPAPTE